MTRPCILLGIEIAPYEVSKRSAPAVLGIDEFGAMSPEWRLFREQVRAEFGLTLADVLHDLTDIYRLDGLTGNLLLHLLDEQIQTVIGERGNAHISELVSPLCGGLFIQNGLAETLTSPGCCSHLSVVREISEIVARRSPAWTDVWVGHDMDRVEVRVCEESRTLTMRFAVHGTEDWRPPLRFDSEDFHQQLNDICRQQERLALQIAEVVEGTLAEDERLPFSRLAAGLGPG